MKFPADLRYTKEHEWVRVSGREAVCGITDFAQSELGDIVFAELPAKGKVMKQGETLCVVESTKAASDVYSPLSGEVLEANIALSEKPEEINSDPYGAGWLVKFRNIDLAQVESLMDSKAYQALLGDKI